MSRAAIFIDGGYLDRILKDEFNSAKVDYAKLTCKIAGSIDLLRAYYYHCLPYQGNPPTLEERERFSKTQRFFEALEKLPRFEVRLGKLEYRGRDEQGEPILKQKRVDLLMGIDLVRLATKQQITHAFLIAGDSDLLPAVEVAKSEGVLIHLWHGRVHRPHNDLWRIADERTAFTQEFIKQVHRA
jgi:uncharacterized LabA/DUF88 family protein